MTLEPLTLEDMEQIRRWRHEVPETLRTPYMLTREMQEDYYHNVICNRDSKTRYWALKQNRISKDFARCEFMGYGGIENISWENRNGEMSLLIDPGYRGEGYGKEAVRLFLDQAFGNLNLYTVYGECYYSGPVGFWAKMIEIYGGTDAYLPCRKYYDGKYYGSYYFTFYRSKYYECDMCDSGEGHE